jgi:hypothetical protein
MNKLFAAVVIVIGFAATASSANAGAGGDYFSYLSKMNPRYKSCVVRVTNAVTPSERRRLSGTISDQCARTNGGMWLR